MQGNLVQSEGIGAAPGKAEERLKGVQGPLGRGGLCSRQWQQPVPRPCGRSASEAPGIRAGGDPEGLHQAAWPSPQEPWGTVEGSAAGPRQDLICFSKGPSGCSWRMYGGGAGGRVGGGQSSQEAPASA